MRIAIITLAVFTLASCAENQNIEAAVAGAALVAGSAVLIAAAEHTESHQSDSSPEDLDLTLCADNCLTSNGMPRADCLCSAVVASSMSNDDKYKLAAIITGIAAAAEVVQTAAALNPQNRPSTDLCCKRCKAGEFPCGDQCRPLGCLPPCFEPPGCACYDGGDPLVTPPMQPPLVTPVVQ